MPAAIRYERAASVNPSLTALDELTQLLGIGNVYSFQLES